MDPITHKILMERGSPRGETRPVEKGSSRRVNLQSYRLQFGWRNSHSEKSTGFFGFFGFFPGPILYSSYISPLDDIVRHDGLEFHLYAEDTQLSSAFRPITAEQQPSLARIEACVSHVDSWLVRNKLKINTGKTKLLILNASHCPRLPFLGHPSIQ